VDASSSLEIPRGSYGLTMAGVTLLGMACAGVTAAALGGSGAAVGWAIAAVGIGSFATAAPALLTISRDYWGVAVLFCGASRSLIMLAVAFALSRAAVPGSPLVIAVVVAAVLILILESAAAIRILAQLERRSATLKQSAQPA
jgi:hypothetical protein